MCEKTILHISDLKEYVHIVADGNYRKERLDEIGITEERKANLRCYRGQSDSRWRVAPSVLREDGNRNRIEKPENELLKELILEEPAEFRDLNSAFELLVHAQHFGLPTRLLDVTTNALVALFFACNKKIDVPENSSLEKNAGGRVYFYDFLDCNIKYPDSDTISIICNLAKFTEIERRELHVYISEKFKNRHDQPEKFLKHDLISRLVYFIKSEKPYFENKLILDSFKGYYFVKTAKFNKRIVAQSGAFIVSAFNEFYNITANQNKIIVGIKEENKKNILSQLDEIGINRKALFPGIESSAAYVKGSRW